MEKKSSLICFIAVIVISVLFIGLAVFAVIQDESMKNEEMQTDNTTDENKPNKDMNSSIPPIKEEPQINGEEHEIDIDVSDMTRNHQAEVIETEIEYGTIEEEDEEIE